MKGFLWITLTVLVVLSCSQSQEAPTTQKKLSPSKPAGQEVVEEDAFYADVSGAGEMDSPKLAMEKERRSKRDESKNEKDAEKTEPSLAFVFLSPTNQAVGRYLEYNVRLSYKTDDFEMARLYLINIVSKYGFMRSSSATASGYSPYMNTEMAVKSAELFNALKEFDKLGLLVGEDIRLIDHTENMVIAKRNMRREEIRIRRKNTAFGQITAGSRNWADVESSLAESEDNQDNAEHREWKINDTVAWATVTIYLEGPKFPKPIEVPVFQNALTDMLNGLLIVVYALIYWIPFIAIAIVIFLLRKRIIGIFKRKNKEN